MTNTAETANWNWDCVLITGGAGGLGRAFAELFVKRGKKVIIAGRTESKLKQTFSEVPGLHGYLVVDVADVKSLPAFAKAAVEKYPEIDCIVANAGIQKPIAITKLTPDEILTAADAEIDVNIRGVLHFVHHFLPHLLTKPRAAIFAVGSGISFAPAAFVPVYCATKAFIHSWMQSLRHQLLGKVRVVEIVPPLVDSDLHRDHPDPKAYSTAKNPYALPIDKFIAQITEDMDAGKDAVAAGHAREHVAKYDKVFGPTFKTLNSH
ncbi:short-chain dehydrogenase [Fimicolochytrium jonesii]|uniref:short-chain dehydrogenase n=1 Tax=Fimicolochytrium jonesii TaxID=1396493 RepID=UPI0022FE7EC7|nr:short-chain dehydrogenase [Fimicolochytrium jonesii]KAI8818006.1 short-chain dehydrogenase [Fimicolochytrium jonesii]